jgi:hypothetical protein
MDYSIEIDSTHLYIRKSSFLVGYIDLETGLVTEYYGEDWIGDLKILRLLFGL